MKRLSEIIVYAGCLIISAVAIYILALAGEPQSKWLVCQVMNLC